MIEVQLLGTCCRSWLELTGQLGTTVAQLGQSDVHIERVADERIGLRRMPLDATLGLLFDGTQLRQRIVASVVILVNWPKFAPVGEES